MEPKYIGGNAGVTTSTGTLIFNATNGELQLVMDDEGICSNILSGNIQVVTIQLLINLQINIITVFVFTSNGESWSWKFFNPCVVQVEVVTCNIVVLVVLVQLLH